MTFLQCVKIVQIFVHFYCLKVTEMELLCQMYENGNYGRVPYWRIKDFLMIRVLF